MDIDFDWTRGVEPMEPGMEFLMDNFDNLQKVIGCGGRTFYVDSEGKPLFMYQYHQGSENGYVYINYERIWFILGKDFGLKYGEIDELMKKWLDESYNLIGFIPYFQRGKILQMLKETFNLR